MRRLHLLGALGSIVSLAIACSSSSPSESDAGPTGDSGTSGGDAGTSSGDAGTTPVDPVACSDYCALLAKNCTGKLEQYTDIDCEGVCTENSKWNAGTPGETKGNTLACRVTHAKAAATDQAANCVVAGKSGGGVCGGLCENFCRLSAKNCIGGNQIYKDDATCMSTCGSWDAEKTDCLIYHLNVASEDAKTHCPHGAADSRACG